MQVSFSTKTLACQPLRSFGNSQKPQQKDSPSNTSPAFSSGSVSREEYDKLNAKYDLLSRFAVAQVEQYNQLAAKYKALLQK